MRTVLVVESDAEQRDELTHLLVRNGYDVIATGTAYEALRRVLMTRPDMAIIDIDLPDHSGVDLTLAMRATTFTARVPVIAITTYSGSVDGLVPLFGVECILVKPIAEADLLTALERCHAPEHPVEFERERLQLE